MTMRSIFLLAPAESASVDSGAVVCAIALARRSGARLTVLCTALDVTTPGAPADAEALAHRIDAAATAAVVDLLLLTEHSHAIGLPQVIAEHARHHDLSVIGALATGLLSERMLAEQLLFGSGRPVLLVPARWAGEADWASSTVAWDNSAPAARALADASDLLGIDTVRLLGIAGDKPFGYGLDTSEVVRFAARRGLAATPVSVELGGRSIGTALQDETLTAGHQLLVMGAFGHSRLHRFVLGSATAAVLDELRMPVLMSH